MSSPSITVPEVSTHKATNESSADEIGDMPWESGFDSRETHRKRMLRGCFMRILWYGEL
jgi:hypothetical protein